MLNKILVKIYNKDLKMTEHCMRWNVNNSTMSSIKYIFSYCSKMTALHHNVKNCHNTLTVLTLMEDPSSTYTVKNCHNTLTVLTLMEDPSSTCRMGQLCVTYVDMTQDSFVLPAPPVQSTETFVITNRRK